jgi:malate dehydrogenase (oxaloacetate-decarboxylating)
MDYNQLALEAHKLHKGKLGTHSIPKLETRDDLSTYYSPGVAAPCLAIEQNPDLAYDYTWKSRTIAVVSDGSAVLWLGNLGWLASLPVMEGKCILFKEFGWVDAVPIVLNTQNPDEIIETVLRISPTFGGINLEDIKAPECFYIEEELKKRAGIPIFHDDQHGTAIVVLAGLINALKVTNKTLSDIKIVMTGAGAAGIAIAKLLWKAGATNIIMIDTKWAIHHGRTDLNKYKQQIADYNRDNLSGSLSEVIVGADVFIGVSGPGTLNQDMVRGMSTNAIVFGLANPIPEIMPEDAKAAWAVIVATGRSDYPNQINNVLVFPGLFKWVLAARIPQITDNHKLAAALALANYIQNPTVDCIISNALDKWVANIIAQAVMQVSV